MNINHCFKEHFYKFYKILTKKVSSLFIQTTFHYQLLISLIKALIEIKQEAENEQRKLNQFIVSAFAYDILKTRIPIVLIGEISEYLKGFVMICVNCKQEIFISVGRSLICDSFSFVCETCSNVEKILEIYSCKSCESIAQFFEELCQFYSNYLQFYYIYDKLRIVVKNDAIHFKLHNHICYCKGTRFTDLKLCKCVLVYYCKIYNNCLLDFDDEFHTLFVNLHSEEIFYRNVFDKDSVVCPSTFQSLINYITKMQILREEAEFFNFEVNVFSTLLQIIESKATYKKTMIYIYFMKWKRLFRDMQEKKFILSLIYAPYD